MKTIENCTRGLLVCMQMWPTPSSWDSGVEGKEEEENNVIGGILTGARTDAGKQNCTPRPYLCFGPRFM